MKSETQGKKSILVSMNDADGGGGGGVAKGVLESSKRGTVSVVGKKTQSRSSCSQKQGC